MRITKAFWLFYYRVMVPSVLVSGVIGMASGSFSTYNFGLAYVFAPLLFQYLIYELINSHEYYAYYNIGLSKIALWSLNLVASASIGLFIANLL